MKIESVEVKPMGLSHEPEFHISIEYSYSGTCLLPLRFNGYLFLDRYRIAFLTEYEFNHGRRDSFVTMNSSKSADKRDRRVFCCTYLQAYLGKVGSGWVINRMYLRSLKPSDQ